jgi:hypothetical protein
LASAPAKSGSVGKALKAIGNNFQGASQQGQQPSGTFAAGQTIGSAIGKGLNALFGSGQQAATPTTAGSTSLDQLSQTGVANNDVESNQAGGAADTVSDNTGVLAAAKGGKVPALVSPGERYLPPKDAKEAAMGKKDPMKAGEKIPGKPKVKGAKNSYANDTVPKSLEEGGIVIPRSVTQGPYAHVEAMKFVRAAMAKQSGKLPPKVK